MSAPSLNNNGGNACNNNNSRAQQISYADLMKPDEDWRVLPDAAERRRIQNRLAQRAYRRNMRDRTKELEKLKKELATLKKDPVGQVSPRMSPPQQPVATMVSAPSDDFIFDGTMSSDMGMASAWTEPFPSTQFEASMNMESYFPQVPEMARPGSKRRRTSSSEGHMAPRPGSGGLSVGAIHGHQRSRSHTPISSPPMVNAALMQDGLATPPMAEFFPSPCNFDLGSDMTNQVSLPQTDDIQPFTLDGFTNDCNGDSNNNNNTASSSLDQGLWTPPMTGSLYGSFLTPPTQHQDGASSPPNCWQNSTPSTVRSENMGRSRSCSSASNVSPFSAATSQFSSPALSATAKAVQPSGLNLNMVDATSHDKMSMLPTIDGNIITTPITNQSQSSLLHLAVSGGHLSVLKLLLQSCDIPINTRDAKGYTALQRAVFAGKMEMVTLLIEHGADFSAGRQDDGAEAAAEHAAVV
ncbi:hypothetical protein MCOR27_005493 [Pyricularia oryzae]|uniref:BZIP domain-containing protein n=1 Tax=Pyricularia grisea TaxID=148305 RepID=A0ABQ8NQR3_PYRGI|nr:hypothetical protein MCOR01_009391 [Pyricularia oryzae]KAI6300722.1 hypothetical protein MCOR33_003637 [Pyricularia grisea]KAI6252519.1 hypothetical protein MCOR19_010874 [Pyricularia oryzae]KAI6272180.1 hypothetical protein MCOR26_007479 [Pyricularia oryzae]KAI6278663.1 hypothetical protein MCOR27_005493 [Pyricularia oryzae]